MFSGIVETVGTVTAVREGEDVRAITIRAVEIVEELTPGASVAVDGACLTVVALAEDGFTVDAVGTTLARTVAGSYRPGARVNLERAMRLGDRLDGHLVQGHVDALGELLEVVPAGEYHRMDFRLPPIVAKVTILHGSITINGVSLTVNALPATDVCQVAVIPYTWSHTNLAHLEPGEGVNLEGDLIGKYVGSMLAARGVLKEAGDQDDGVLRVRE